MNMETAKPCVEQCVFREIISPSIYPSFVDTKHSWKLCGRCLTTVLGKIKQYVFVCFFDAEKSFRALRLQRRCWKLLAKMGLGKNWHDFVVGNEFFGKHLVLIIMSLVFV